ncbi:hypothetical protein GCM10022377_15920 [Zhihengliuella alba]|uniref:Uncharacterized protein n=1 Tax=Zhihengliuella alba TaxID=547018 RepID=A0ABP7DAI8_9MICC
MLLRIPGLQPTDGLPETDSGRGRLPPGLRIADWVAGRFTDRSFTNSVTGHRAGQLPTPARIPCHGPGARLG